MPVVSSKHAGRVQKFPVKSFHGGYTEEAEPYEISVNQLSDICNMKYVKVTDVYGNPVIIAKVRQGTVKLTTNALPSAVKACWLYTPPGGSQELIYATDSKLYKEVSGVQTELGSLDGIPTFTEFNDKLIIHDGGVTKYYDGINFGKLTWEYDDENLGTGDGTTVTFSGTLEHPTVKASTLTISYVSTDSKSISDNGTGRLTGDVVAAKNITNITQANPAQVTCSSHGFSTGDKVHIQDVEGMTEVNDQIYTITVVDADNFTLDGVDSTGYNAYTSGGTASGNIIVYSTGEYKFTCSSAPDDTTSITATYEKVDGAPKSKAGFVRAERLYMYQDPDNKSRLWYSAVRNEKGWDGSTGGGYVDVELKDGYELVGAENFFSRVILVKGNSIHHLKNFPGDSDFRVEPLIPNLGGVAYRTVISAGSFIFFLGAEGLLFISATDEFGDIKRNLISKAFQKTAVKYANSNTFACYNPNDGHYYISFYDEDKGSYLSKLYVLDINLGLLSKYKFAFGQHTALSFCHDKMLIGADNGHVYELVNDESTFKDDHDSYASDTYIQGAYTDWDLPNNRKHNKKIHLKMAARLGATANLKLYLNHNFDEFATINTVLSMVNPDIGVEGELVDIADMDLDIAYAAYDFDFSFGYKFSYRDLMWRLENINSLLGAEILGIEFYGAILGD